MRVQTVTRNGIARISMDPNPERSTCDGVEVAQHDRPATLSSSSPSSPQWLLTRTRFHVPRRPPSNRSPRLTRNQNGGGSIHRSPFDGPPDGSVPDWSRGEERTGKTATGPISPRSVRVRTYSEASRGGWVFAPSLSLSLSLCPRRFRDSWQRVPRAFGSIDSKTRPRKGRNIPDYDVTESERICWKGRLLITCRRKFGKTFRSFETIVNWIEGKQWGLLKRC